MAATRPMPAAAPRLPREKAHEQRRRISLQPRAGPWAMPRPPRLSDPALRPLALQPHLPHPAQPARPTPPLLPSGVPSRRAPQAPHVINTACGSCRCAQELAASTRPPLSTFAEHIWALSASAINRAAEPVRPRRRARHECPLGDLGGVDVRRAQHYEYVAVAHELVRAESGMPAVRLLRSSSRSGWPSSSRMAQGLLPCVAGFLVVAGGVVGVARGG